MQLVERSSCRSMSAARASSLVAQASMAAAMSWLAACAQLGHQRAHGLWAPARRSPPAAPAWRCCRRGRRMRSRSLTTRRMATISRRSPATGACWASRARERFSMSMNMASISSSPVAHLLGQLLVALDQRRGRQLRCSSRPARPCARPPGRGSPAPCEMRLASCSAFLLGPLIRSGPKRSRQCACRAGLVKIWPVSPNSTSIPQRAEVASSTSV